MLGHPVSDLFTPAPWQWGLRGDPYLWHELRARVGERPLPDDLADVEALLREAICEILGMDWAGFLSAGEPYVPELAHGGMSSGHVHVRTWTDRLIPLLLARAKALHDYSGAR